MGPLQHVDLMYSAINLHWNDEVCITDGLERAVDEGFVQVNHHTIPAVVCYTDLWQKELGWRLGRTAILLWRRGQSEGLVVGGWGLHVVVIVVAEAAEEGAENASTPVLLEAAVGLGDFIGTRRNALLLFGICNLCYYGRVVHGNEL